MGLSPNLNARARQLANLCPGDPATLRHDTNLQHGGWSYMEGGTLPETPTAAIVAEELRALEGTYVARCGGASIDPDAGLLIRQLVRVSGFMRLVELWSEAQVQRAYKAKRLTPGAGLIGRGGMHRAISADWTRFANQQARLLEQLRPYPWRTAGAPLSQ